MDRTDSKNNTQEAHAGSLKVLQRLADQVEYGDPSMKATRSFYLRKLYRAFTGAQRPN